MATGVKNVAKTPAYQTAYHGENSSNPLTRLLQKIVERADKRSIPKNTLDAFL